MVKYWRCTVERSFRLKRDSTSDAGAREAETSPHKFEESSVVRVLQRRQDVKV
ncbi:MAG: hypothetical protein F6K08_18205 [Okeania sp. SIO1H6]|nr:hypothetical protein [Okeania sp. SIO1H6]